MIKATLLIVASLALAPAVKARSTEPNSGNAVQSAPAAQTKPAGPEAKPAAKEEDCGCTGKTPRRRRNRERHPGLEQGDR